MAKLWVLFVSVLVFISLTDAVSKRDRNDYTKNPKRLVCYFGSWANYHKSEPFLIEDINYDLCTHVSYGFAKLDEYNYTILPFDPYLEIELLAYKRFAELRKKNPQLTTMVALGGWYEGSEKYSDMAKDPSRRAQFVDSVVKFLKKYDFDGLDVDWEYPANRLGQPYDKQNFLSLMKELKAAFQEEGYLLTAALSPGKPTIDKAYEDIHQLNDLLDWANVMTYDYHGGWEDTLGHNAPLYSRPDEVDDLHKWFNVNFTINYYLEMGLKKEKMVMGVPFYGRAWTMESGKIHLKDSAKGMSPKGWISGEEGVLGYNEICQLEMKDPSKWTNKYDPYYRAPYAYGPYGDAEVWIGFDNQESLSCKIAYLKKMDLSGGMVWSLENDDFKNRCGGGKYPLLKRVHAMLNGDKKDSFECNLGGVTDAPTTVTPTTTEPTTRPTTTEPTTRPTTPEPTTPTTEPTTKPTTVEVTTPTTPTTTPTTPEPTTPTTRPTTKPTTAEPTTVKPTEGTTEEPKVTKIIDDCIDGKVCIVKCFHPGKFPHPGDIHKFVECEFIENGPNKGWWIHIMPCAPGTKWNQAKLECILDQ